MEITEYNAILALFAASFEKEMDAKEVCNRGVFVFIDKDTGRLDCEISMDDSLNLGPILNNLIGLMQIRINNLR